MMRNVWLKSRSSNGWVGGGGHSRRCCGRVMLVQFFVLGIQSEAVFVLLCSKKKKEEKFASVQFPTHHLDVVSPAKTSGPVETV